MAVSIAGLELDDLPEGCVSVEAIVLVRALDEGGDMAMYTRSSDGVTAAVSIGMLTMALDRARVVAAESFTQED